MPTFDFSRFLIRRYGSPLYVYDLLDVEERHRELRAVLPTAAPLLYSMKANPLPPLCALLKDAGCAVELSSLGELEVARRVGFELDGALYTGPGKTDEEVDAALLAGVGYFSCESQRDMRRLSAAAGAKCQILLRINPTEAAVGGLSMSGPGTQFGFSQEGLLASEALSRASEQVVGLHIYCGTQLASPGSLESSFRLAATVAQRMVSELAFRPRVVDLGGGFPWPFGVSGSGRSLQTLQPCLAELARDVLPISQLWFESGRYLSASCGTLLSSVQDVKKSSQGPVQLILDTGIHHLGGMSGLQRIARPTLSLLTDTLAHGLDSQNRSPIEADVFGPLCTPLDCLGRRLQLSALPKIGDCVQIPNVGAYGLTASLTGFLSRPAPLEIVTRGEQVVGTYRLRTGHEAIV
jgi:diaminopimelate decarboxylase